MSKSDKEMLIEATYKLAVERCMEIIDQLPIHAGAQGFKKICLEELAKLKTGDVR